MRLVADANVITTNFDAWLEQRDRRWQWMIAPELGHRILAKAPARPVEASRFNDRRVSGVRARTMRGKQKPQPLELVNVDNMHLNMATVLALIGRSGRATVYRWEAKGLLPRHHSINGEDAWWSHEVRAALMLLGLPLPSR